MSREVAGWLRFAAQLATATCPYLQDGTAKGMDNFFFASYSHSHSSFFRYSE
jgi:hypothetical protein